MSAVQIILALIAAGIAFYGCFRIAKDPLLGVCLFIFLSSITISPSLPIVGDRLVIADFVMIYTIFICMFQGQFFDSPLPGLKLVDQLAFIFICLATISSLLVLISGGEAIRSILFLVIYLYGYCCFRLIIRIVRDRKALERLLSWWVAGAVLVIVVGFMAATGIYKPAWTFDPVINRISATLKLSGQVASYLGPAIFILFYLAATRRISRPLQIGVVALIFAGAFVLLSAGSRMSFLIMIFSIAAGTWIVVSARQRSINRFPLLFTTVIATLSFFSFAVTVWTDTSTTYGLVTTSPTERAIKMWSEQVKVGSDMQTLGGTRYDEISQVLQNFEEHMFLGTGSGLFSQTYQTNEVHNTYFSILGENGIFAFLIFIYWWALMFFVLLGSIKRAAGENRLVLKLGFCAFLMLSLYQMTTNGMRQRPFWFTPALALSTAIILSRPMSSVIAGPIGREKLRR